MCALPTTVRTSAAAPSATKPAPLAMLELGGVTTIVRTVSSRALHRFSIQARRIALMTCAEPPQVSSVDNRHPCATGTKRRSCFTEPRTASSLLIVGSCNRTAESTPTACDPSRRSARNARIPRPTHCGSCTAPGACRPSVDTATTASRDNIDRATAPT